MKEMGTMFKSTYDELKENPYNANEQQQIDKVNAELYSLLQYEFKDLSPTFEANAKAFLESYGDHKSKFEFDFWNKQSNKMVGPSQEQLDAMVSDLNGLETEIMAIFKKIVKSQTKADAVDKQMKDAFQA